MIFAEENRHVACTMYRKYLAATYQLFIRLVPRNHKTGSWETLAEKRARHDATNEDIQKVSGKTSRAGFSDRLCFGYMQIKGKIGQVKVMFLRHWEGKKSKRKHERRNKGREIMKYKETVSFRKVQ